MVALVLEKAEAKPAQTPHGLELLDVMDDIEYRRIVAPEDFEAVGILRQRAIDAFDIYERKFGESVIEDMDFDPMSAVFGVYFRGELAATIRIKRVTADSRDSGAIQVFDKFMHPLLDQGMEFIDPCRFAINRDISRLVTGLPIITSRLAIVATLHYMADYCLFACKLEHTGFYRRVFRATMLAGPYEPPGMRVRAVLLGNGTAGRDELFARYPIFKFKSTEARLLFGEQDLSSSSLCVKPTARIAQAAA
ncbi:MAG: hypothetical protein AAGF25_11630 [Pseudomonadota bacterium]